jgi:hypothetical protein
MTEEKNEENESAEENTPGKLPGQGAQPETQRVNETRPQDGGDPDSAAEGAGPSGGA